MEDDSTIAVKLIPIQSNDVSNLYIDSCWFATPFRQLNQPEQLTIRIKNISKNDFENVPVKLMVNRQQKALASFSIEAEGMIDTTLFFTSTEAGVQHAEVVITDYPITFDDRFYFSYEVAENISVLCISQEDTNAYISSLFGSDPFFRLTQYVTNNIDYSVFNENDLIVLADVDNIPTGLSQLLKKFVSEGGNLLIFPSPVMDIAEYTEFLLLLNSNYYTKVDTQRTKVGSINLEHIVFEDVFEKIPRNMDLPTVNQHFPLSSNIETSQEQLLGLDNGNAFLTRSTFEKGRLYLCSAPLDAAYSSFARHAIFVPTLYKIALQSQVAERLYYTIGKDQSVEIKSPGGSAENVIHLSSTNADFDMIPEHRIVNARSTIFFHGQVLEAGSYLISLGKEILSGLAFNYERSESDLSTYSPEELLQLATHNGLTQVTLINTDNDVLSRQLEKVSEGRKFWKWCILLTLLFLACEIVLLRLWR